MGPEAPARAGVCDVVNNTAWLEDRFPAARGSGARRGLSIRDSMEGREHGGTLETASGIAKVLPGLHDPFRVATGDMFPPGFDLDVAHAERFASRRAGTARPTLARPRGWRH